MTRPNRLNLRPELQAVLDAIEAAPGAPAPEPARDWRLIAFKQLEQLHRKHFQTIETLEAMVQDVKLSARAALVEISCRRELIEESLGICRHQFDTADVCSKCGMQGNEGDCG